MDSLLEVGRHSWRIMVTSRTRCGCSAERTRPDGVRGFLPGRRHGGPGGGARSYTRDVHYSTDWAVDGTAVESVLDAYLARGSEDFAQADHGIHLSMDDRKRRFVIKSILKARGWISCVMRKCSEARRDRTIRI
ncbi:MAG: hypothetical protein IPN71_16470 [Fibrobacteres bacterium]|nr:hypothetical protein [Fibrobacterota bacterium]